MYFCEITRNFWKISEFWYKSREDKINKLPSSYTSVIIIQQHWGGSVFLPGSLCVGFTAESLDWTSVCRAPQWYLCFQRQFRAGRINVDCHQGKLWLHLHAWSHSVIEHTVVRVLSVKLFTQTFDSLLLTLCVSINKPAKRIFWSTDEIKSAIKDMWRGSTASAGKWDTSNRDMIISETALMTVF